MRQWRIEIGLPTDPVKSPNKFWMSLQYRDSETSKWKDYPVRYAGKSTDTIWVTIYRVNFIDVLLNQDGTKGCWKTLRWFEKLCLKEIAKYNKKNNIQNETHHIIKSFMDELSDKTCPLDTLDIHVYSKDDPE